MSCYTSIQFDVYLNPSCYNENFDLELFKLWTFITLEITLCLFVGNKWLLSKIWGFYVLDLSLKDSDKIVTQTVVILVTIRLSITQ